MTRDQAAEDLAYVRTVAEEGQQAPLIGGVYLVLFGVLLSVGYVLHWSLLSGVLQFGVGDPFLILWSVYCALALVGVLMLRQRTMKLPGGSSVANRVSRTVWRSVGFGIMAVVAGCITRMLAYQDFQAPNAIMAAAFAMFGIALLVTATISAQAWIGMFGALAFISSVALWVTMNEPWAYLLAAGAGIVVLILPGVMMMRREPSTII